MSGIIIMYVCFPKSARETLAWAYRNQYKTGWCNFTLVIKDMYGGHTVLNGDDKVFLDPELKCLEERDLVLLKHDFSTCDLSKNKEEEIFSMYDKYDGLEPTYPSMLSHAKKVIRDNLFILPKKENKMYYVLGTGLYKTQIFGNDTWVTNAPSKGPIEYNSDIVGEFDILTGKITEKEREDYCV